MCVRGTGNDASEPLNFVEACLACLLGFIEARQGQRLLTRGTPPSSLIVTPEPASPLAFFSGYLLEQLLSHLDLLSEAITEVIETCQIMISCPNWKVVLTSYPWHHRIGHRVPRTLPHVVQLALREHVPVTCRPLDWNHQRSGRGTVWDFLGRFFPHWPG